MQHFICLTCRYNNIVGFVNTCYFHITFYNNCPLEVCGTDQWLHSMLNNLASSSLLHPEPHKAIYL